MRNFLEKHWKLTSFGILALGILWIMGSAAPPGSTTAGAIPAPHEGFLAPNFELVSLKGEPVALADLRGKAVLVNFWASWCRPCRSEMPAMQKIYDEYGPDKFVILAINDPRQDALSDIENFVAAKNLTFPILLENNGQVSNQYMVRSLPTSFFIDPQGIIQEIVIGGMSEALLITRIQSLLAGVD